MLGGLSVPLSWGVAVPPDDYDHWAPAPEDAPMSSGRKGADAEAAAMDEWGEWRAWNEWWRRTLVASVPRSSSGVIPHSPAAG